jgi:stromal membrane-associated protein
MQLIGNSRGRAIYEAQVSEEFRRPQTDAQLEVFIRAKYEKKKYIAREWVPTRAPEYPAGW